MDPSAADPSGISVPIYDEDPEESFIGPVGLVNFFAEESDAPEREDDDYGEDEYYDGEAYQPTPLEGSGPQRASHPEVAQPETGSGHTQ